MTFTEAKKIVKALGLRLTRTEYDDYRVAYAHDAEVSAYYTDDLQDAVETAQAMVK